MDNSMALLIIIKREVNIGCLLYVLYHFEDEKGRLPSSTCELENYMIDSDIRLSYATHRLTDFECCYLCSFLSFMGCISQ